MHPIVKEFEERIGRELKVREKGVLGELLDKHIKIEVDRLRVFETYVMHTDQDAYRKLKGKVIE